MTKVHLRFDKRKDIIPHFIQPITGFIALHRKKIISMSIDLESEIDIPIPNTFAAEIGNRVCYFDESDGSDHFLTDEHIDFLHRNNIILFKRSYDSSRYGGDPNIKPLGLNYIGNFLTLPRRILLHYCFKKDRSSHLAHWLYGFLDLDAVWSFRHKTVRPAANEGRIIFSTRLWESKGAITPVDELNRTRIETVKAIREYFKERAVAGIYDSALAREMCPELILPASITGRKNYIELMNRSSICITTTGLHRSTGWKFAEFVAAGKAIVSEPLAFLAPGGLSANRNYLPFESTDQLLSSIDDLLSHPRAIRDMEKENTDYYFHYLRPDALVFNAIEQYI